MSKLANAPLKRATALVFHLDLLELSFFVRSCLNVDESCRLWWYQKAKMMIHGLTNSIHYSTHKVIAANIDIHRISDNSSFHLPCAPYTHRTASPPLSPQKKRRCKQEKKFYYVVDGHGRGHLCISPSHPKRLRKKQKETAMIFPAYVSSLSRIESASYGTEE